MQKKKGFVLLFTIITFLLLITLSISLLTLSTYTVLTNSSYEKIEKVTLTAESGIEKGLNLLYRQDFDNPETNTVLNIYNNIKTKLGNNDNFNFSMYDNLTSCTVTFGYETINEIITINSSAVTNDSKYKKSIDVTLKRNKEEANLNLLKYTISVIGGSKNLNNDLFGAFHGSIVNSSQILMDGSVYFKTDTLSEVTNTSEIKVLNNNFVYYYNNADNFSSLVTDSTKLIQKSKPLILNILRNDKNTVSFNKAGTYYIELYVSSSPVSLYEINKNILAQRDENGIPVSDENIYKILILNNDLNIYNEINGNNDCFRNYIIYCNGSINFNGKSTGVVEFVNSAICTKSFNFSTLTSVKFNMLTLPQGIKENINETLNNQLFIWKITSWKE